VGLFAILGYLVGAEIDILFVVALLTILGYSVNDTIVVFDRVRENLKENQERNQKEDFELTVGKSLDQTFARSINTSFTTVLVLLALFFLGGVVTENFALVLIVGIVAGTYSSLALASPLLVLFQSRRSDEAFER
jgi:preprotein translocase subunit SecF